MAKRELEDILETIKAFEIDADAKIALLEDISDSFVTEAVTGFTQEDIDNAKAETEAVWKDKYMQRFGLKPKTEEVKKESVEEKPALDVKTITDIVASFNG